MHDIIPSYAIPIQGFQPLKAAEVVSIFVALSGATIEKLKLVKLIYLAEREHLRNYEEPITWDEFFSLPHGPVASGSLNCIDGIIYSDLMSHYFVSQGRRNIHAKRNFSADDCVALNECEIETVRAVWNAHGKKTASQLRNYTHQECPEYFELEYGRRPISYCDILKAVGNPDADQISEEILSYRELFQRVDDL